jgi:uncharacterized secreted protein with C-terminal beta-propeller domain
MAESTARAEGGSGVYQTNVQVEGIDESDIVKTDGTNIYFYRFDSETGNSQITVVRPRICGFSPSWIWAGTTPRRFI